MASLLDLSFLQELVQALPADPSRVNEPRQVQNAAYSFVEPTPVRASQLVGWSEDLAALFTLVRPPQTGPEVELLAGSRVLPSMKPYASCYGGHQFGHWAGQLGDGRAITLGEVLDQEKRSWEFQLKGAGPTPYSRTADGRAVLRSSIREFVCSEAMHHLGVPTTRALSVVLTGEAVVRDMFYDGNPEAEPGAVVCRVAPSFVRFGNFEIFAARGQAEPLRALLDYVTQRFFSFSSLGEDRYLDWFLELCRRTGLLLAHWTRVGFVHGVMNTDNMSALGLTIDYGPYGWLDDFDPSWTPNTTDLPGRRYCFGRQPGIALWNLAQLARTLLFLLPGRAAALEAALGEYEASYQENFLRMSAQKLGFARLEGSADQALFTELGQLLQAAETDMTLFYRGLSTLPLAGEWSSSVRGLPSFLIEALYQADPSLELATRWLAWLEQYRARARSDQADPAARIQSMNAANPLYVPRNYLLQEAIEAAHAGDFSPVANLLEVFRKPYTAQPGREHFAEKRPDWARSKPGCSTLSCSS